MNESDIHIRKIKDSDKFILKEIAQNELGTSNISAYVRFLISDAIKKYKSSDSQKIKKSNIDLSDRTTKVVKCSFYLGEYKELENRSRQSICSPSFYCSTLIKTHLHQNPYFLNNELEAIRESNYQLASIGRNLNQIAKRLNANLNTETIASEKIDHLAGDIKKHVEKVNIMMEASIKRLGRE